jgi:coatomer protein complex subunit gamma
MFSLAAFEHQLVMYVASDKQATFARAFDMSAVPIVTQEQALAEERTKKLTTVTPTLKAPSAGAKKAQANGTAEGVASAVAQAQRYTQQLLAIPEINAYGAVLKSSVPVELTESETEYVVSVVKHIFKDHIVLQYDVTNTLPDTVLEEVSVLATPSEDEEVLEEDFIIPVASLKTDEPGTVYASFKKTGESPFAVTTFTNILKFTSKETDPTTGEPDANGYEDEYQVEDVELTGSDYVVPAFSGNFDHIWEQAGANGEEESETLQLSNVKSIAGQCRGPSWEAAG